MKTFKLFVIGVLLFLSIPVNAQIHVNINIGTPPQWGPVGYAETQYYYLPEIEAYYDVPTGVFIYLSGKTWVRRAQLPPQYRNYDLYHGYKVVMNDYHGKTPYIYFKSHKLKYPKGNRYKAQKNFRDEKSDRGNKKNNKKSKK